jgi:hypothetical protein
MVLGYLVIVGVSSQSSQGDERAPARIFQLLLAAQLPIMVFFGMKWLPREPKHAILILALQFTAAIVPIATVLFLEW